MSEYTDLIREAREKHVMTDNGEVDFCRECADGDWPCLTIRLADALEVSVARTAELEARIETTRLAATRLNGPQVSA